VAAFALTAVYPDKDVDSRTVHAALDVIETAISGIARAAA
jgi:hypothetical protein